MTNNSATTHPTLLALIVAAALFMELMDAMAIAPHWPAGMLFVPSIGGISHHWTENTSDEDIVIGAAAFVGACQRILQRAE